MKQYETNDKNESKYIMATGNSVAETQTAAKLQAMETAKLELAGQINTQVAALSKTALPTSSSTMKKRHLLPKPLRHPRT